MDDAAGAGFDESYDFVVVGSGGGSMCAGLVMRARGRSVLVIEKSEYLGGTTARSGGTMWIPNNLFMARDGVPDSPAAAERYLDAVIGDDPTAPGSSPARRRAYVAEAPRMLEFIVGQGLRLDRGKWWPDYYDDLPGGSAPGRTVNPELFDTSRLGPWRAKLRPGFLNLPITIAEARLIGNHKQDWRGRAMMVRAGLRAAWNRLRGKRFATCGESLQGQMLLAATRAGVAFRTDTAVTGLIEEDGRIVGVTIDRDGRPWRIGARLGVLVNAGGFAHNQAMRDRWQPGARSEWSSAIRSDTGEMIEEMQRHGAALAQMDEMVGNQQTIAPGTEAADIKLSAQATAAGPHAILVDRTGERYLNEGGSYMAFCKAMRARDRIAPAIPSWAVFDSQHLAKYMVAGTLPGRAKPQRWRDEGYLHEGATIAALAAAIGADPATLEATVARFNGFVAAGRDADFGRGDRHYDHYLGDASRGAQRTLGAIERGPFYAIPVVPGDVGTYGGVVTDADARVLRDDGSVIEGLYATGVSTASVMGRFYPGAGCSVGPSFTFGYIAAKHAAGADNALGVPAREAA